MAFEIYRITHRESGKAYIGCTKRGIAVRWRGHVYESANPRHTCILHRAIAKYGASAFDVGLVAVARSEAEMFRLERQWIAECKTISPCGYNLTSGGDGLIGAKHSDEAKRKMSASRIGKTATPETKAKMSAARMGNQFSKGRVFTPEIRAKISASMKAFCKKRAAIMIGA